MNEIYWITRLSSINTTALIFIVIGIIATVIAIIVVLVNTACVKSYEANDDALGVKEYTGYVNIGKYVLKWSIPIASIALAVKIFVPTTNDALLIYGVGGTIDYIKANPTAKKLPDKCINALDKWVDSWSSNDSTKVSKK